MKFYRHTLSHRERWTRVTQQHLFADLWRSTENFSWNVLGEVLRNLKMPARHVHNCRTKVDDELLEYSCFRFNFYQIPYADNSRMKAVNRPLFDIYESSDLWLSFEVGPSSRVRTKKISHIVSGFVFQQFFQRKRKHCTQNWSNLYRK